MPGRKERRVANPVEPSSQMEWMMTDVILRLGAFAFLIGVFAFAFFINL